MSFIKPTKLINNFTQKIFLLYNDLKICFINKKYIPKYRVTDWIKGNSPDRDKIKVHIINTRNELELSPKDIINDEDLIEGFSPLDVKTIVMLALSIRKQPKYEVVVNEFRNSLYNDILTIKDREKSAFIRQSIQELSNNLDMIDGFSPVDAYNIGRVKGEIETLESYRKLKGLKRTLRS